MATLTTTARGDVRAEPRLKTGSITIGVGAETFLIVCPAEARQLAEALLNSATAIEEQATPSAIISRRHPQRAACIGGAA